LIKVAPKVPPTTINSDGRLKKTARPPPVAIAAITREKAETIPKIVAKSIEFQPH